MRNFYIFPMMVTKTKFSTKRCRSAYRIRKSIEILVRQGFAINMARESLEMWEYLEHKIQRWNSPIFHILKYIRVSTYFFERRVFSISWRPDGEELDNLDSKEEIMADTATLIRTKIKIQILRQIQKKTKDGDK